MRDYDYPHTVDDGGGERLTFLRRLPADVGERVEFEIVVASGSAPPVHAHNLQDEALMVREGRIGYVLSGSAPKTAGPGETVFIPRGEFHRFWNDGDDTLVADGYFEPVGSIEYLIGAFYAMMRDAGGGKVDVFDAAFLLRRYRSEYTLQEIPAPIQRFLFPVIVAVGRVMGKYVKYADAPEPVHRPAAE
jgi:quercetin dioxygenase-like cupin family protein